MHVGWTFLCSNQFVCVKRKLLKWLSAYCLMYYYMYCIHVIPEIFQSMEFFLQKSRFSVKVSSKPGKIVCKIAAHRFFFSRKTLFSHCIWKDSNVFLFAAKWRAFSANVILVDNFIISQHFASDFKICEYFHVDFWFFYHKFHINEFWFVVWGKKHKLYFNDVVCSSLKCPDLTSFCIWMCLCLFFLCSRCELCPNFEFSIAIIDETINPCDARIQCTLAHTQRDRPTLFTCRAHGPTNTVDNNTHSHIFTSIPD